jgi:ATP-dependent Lon protease
MREAAMDEATSRRTGPPRARRLLVVDDDPLVRELFAEALEGEGEVDVAGDGLEALRRLDGRDYDLILADLNMPHLDGYGLFEAVVATRPELGQSFMFVTGATFGGQALSLNGRSLPLLHKPVPMAALASAVHARLTAVDADRPQRRPEPGKPTIR